ncbi:hypothetical protein [Parasutterella sp.]|uniref:hypothetical protein n=1 Tax=Parasutterella sp. TaxID=2049037 RepID=UPI003AB1DC8A
MGRKHDKKEEASIILEILNRIPLSKRFVSVDDILNSLASAEIDVSRRSLQRYLKQMYDCGKYGLVRDDCQTTNSGTPQTTRIRTQGLN